MNNTFLLFYSPKPRNQVWILIYRKCSIVTFLVFTLNGDVFIVILVAYFSQKSRGKQKSAMFSTKKIWKVTILAWDGKRVLVRKNETPPYCKSSALCVISVSDSSVHFVAEFLHCSVKIGLSLQPWDTPSRDPRLKTEPTSRGALYDCASWFKGIFFSTALIIKWSRGGARDVDSPIRMYRYAFKTISWKIETHSELLLSYKSLVTLSDV